jgi:hypothetical protein
VVISMSYTDTGRVFIDSSATVCCLKASISVCDVFTNKLLTEGSLLRTAAHCTCMITSVQKLNSDPVGVSVDSFSISTVFSSCTSGSTRPACCTNRLVSALMYCTSQTRAPRAYCGAQARTTVLSALARVGTKLCLFRLKSLRTAPLALRLPSGLQ